MGKFIIENVLIEKSDKDIKTGEKYSLSDGFNLICGNNEAGKSSLMNFIKQGFFKAKGIDTGKIYFKVNKINYRADIKDARAVDARIKIYDNADTACDYNVIEKSIKQKYFEEGFTINLDDLMKIQNKETAEFINIIKDPSGDKLNTFLEKIQNRLELNLTLDGKLKKNSKEILDKISYLNTKIKELSYKESEYNNNINLIKSLTDEINFLIKKEEYLKIKREINSLEKTKKELTDEKNISESSFNKILYNSKEKYIELIQEYGKFNSNLEVLNKCSQKIELLNSKILQEKTRLNIECGISLSNEILDGLNLEQEKINKIKTLVDESNQISIELEHDNNKLEELENILLKLNCEIETLLESRTKKYNFEEFEELIKTLDEGIKQYHFLSSEIDKANKEIITNANEINTNKNLQILLGILFSVTVLCGVISFINNIQTAGIFSILMALLTFAGYSALKISNYAETQNNEKERREEQRNSLISSLKEKVKPYYAEIDNIEISYLPVKLDSIKQEFISELNEYKSFNNLILKSTSERNYTEQSILTLKTKISNFKDKLSEINKGIKELSDKNISNNNVFGKKYIEAIEIIKSIKDSLSDVKLIEEEYNESKKSNDQITSDIKNFILENEINVAFSENINETMLGIKKYYDNNNILKQHLNTLDAQINSIDNQILVIKEKITEKFDISDVETEEKEITYEKEEKLKQKKEAEFKKRELEKIEGISELKTERNIYIEEYRTLIKNLFVDKMTLELTTMAKSEFDKTQPDLINAQKYLAILTDNKYTKINLELQELSNEDGSKIKKWEHLSRGTKEQLYLALRLGYASNYSIDKTTLEPNGRANLPLIIDDAFVNFDTKRTKNALKCLCEFSKTNQVLFFTCHTESITKMLNEISCESPNIIQL